VGVQSGAQAFGASALESIGVFEDNSTWGKGITVAVIDSGVNQHIALKDGVKRLTLNELAEDDTQLSHGTAVASIISGNHPLTQGVAPAADILSIRITDAQGSSNSFTLAEGIVAATDWGAQIINISMGSEGNSIVVADAVAYAQERGVVIVASAGNEGFDTPSYPAAYDGVISVGAVEASGLHLDFSNTGENLSIVAPGFEVNAAWGNDQLTAFSGTSASAPFVSGAIAAVMSENPGYTAQQATDLVLQLSNEAGQVGRDPQYGQGSLDVGRALENGQPGIYDIAVASQILGSNSAGNPQVTIVIQNQGTEPVFNSPVRIQTPNGITSISINSLSPGQVYTTTLPLPSLSSEENAIVYSSASTSGSEDNQQSNNSRQNSFSQSAK
ncbi:MAG: S8 family serine peptidase, partial [Rubritalea sp.]|uniref:S8 family peptidase n=1 Tax=Rubritalea sp. TaxID=2109375 RepID=UPI003242C759